MTRRILSLIAAVAVLCSCMTVTAHASEGSDWVELLETATVNDAASNLLTFTPTTTIFRIKTPQYMRVTKVDMLIAHPSGKGPTAVKVQYGNVYYTLTLAKIDDCTTRVYGANIPDNLYADLVFQATKSGTTATTWQILSCRVTSLANSILKATAYAEIGGQNYTAPFYYEYHDGESSNEAFVPFQFPVRVTDWQKYDTITVSGSCNSMALNSVRCTIGGLGLPFTMSYAVSNSSGSTEKSYTWNDIKYYSYDQSYQGTSEGTTYSYETYTGKTLFTVTVDLSGLDRTLTDDLFVYFTTLCNDFWGYSIQILQVTGTVRIADTSQVAWWKKFTSFMTGLFAGDTSESDAFQDTADSQGSAMQELNEGLSSLEKPELDEIDLSIEQYVSTADVAVVNTYLGSLTQHTMVATMTMIALTVAFVAYILYGKR